MSASETSSLLSALQAFAKVESASRGLALAGQTDRQSRSYIFPGLPNPCAEAAAFYFQQMSDYDPGSGLLETFDGRFAQTTYDLRILVFRKRNTFQHTPSWSNIT